MAYSKLIIYHVTGKIHRSSIDWILLHGLPLVLAWAPRCRFGLTLSPGTCQPVRPAQPSRALRTTRAGAGVRQVCPGCAVSSTPDAGSEPAQARVSKVSGPSRRSPRVLVLLALAEWLLSHVTSLTASHQIRGGARREPLASRAAPAD